MLQKIPLEEFDTITHELAREYPTMLRSQYVYYVGSGTPRRDRFHLGIVGTRRPTRESRVILRNLFSHLRALPIRVISGGAFGVDSEAHMEALHHGLSTWSWIVGDPRVPTPRSNHMLFKKIVAAPESAILTAESIFNEGSRRLYESQWLERNNWVAASSDALLVVQAQVISGTWSTVTSCHDFGIPVYAILGQTGCPQYEGNNAMISRSYAEGVKDIKSLAEGLIAHALNRTQTIIKDSFRMTEKNIEGINSEAIVLNERTDERPH